MYVCQHANPASAFSVLYYIANTTYDPNGINRFQVDYILRKLGLTLDKHQIDAIFDAIYDPSTNLVGESMFCKAMDVIT